jgi:enoyl-CoA hydratase/carnithine racemase
MNASVETAPPVHTGDATAAPPEHGRVLFHVVNRVAILTLDRPHALNALSHEMVRALAEHVERCRNDDAIAALVLRGRGEKGFCAGGDVRALYRAAAQGRVDGPDGWRRFFIDEYRLDYALHTFGKPIVALADGITMGGGMGLAQAATLRVVTERSKIAMPETRIGFVPDVGATYFLSRLPAALSLYLGLTGAVLGGADAVRCRLADACVPSAWLGAFETRLAQLPPDAVAARLTEAFVPSPAEQDGVAPAPIDALMPAIERHFDPALGIEQMAASLTAALAAEPAHSEQAWLQASLDALAHYSPTMLYVTREALIAGRTLTLADAFRLELATASHAIEEGDFSEGVRAHLVDKDRAPRWRPAAVSEIAPERVRHFLSSPWTDAAHPLADLGRA